MTYNLELTSGFYEDLTFFQPDVGTVQFDFGSEDFCKRQTHRTGAFPKYVWRFENFKEKLNPFRNLQKVLR